MAADFELNDATDKLSLASLPFSGFPFSWSLWFNPESLPGTYRTLFGFDNASTQYFLLGLDTPGGTPRLVLDAANGGANQRANAGATLSAGVWTHGGVVCASATSRAVYQSGNTNKSTSTSSVAFGTYTSRMIGNDGFGEAYDGMLAEFGVWNVALTDAEMDVLGRGMSPLFVRRANLVLYAPLVRDFTDIVGGRVLTNTGVDVGPHCRVFRPPAPHIRRFSTAQPSTGRGNGLVNGGLVNRGLVNAGLVG